MNLLDHPQALKPHELVGSSNASRTLPGYGNEKSVQTQFSIPTIKLGPPNPNNRLISKATTKNHAFSKDKGLTST